MRGRIFRYDHASGEVIESQAPARVAGAPGGGWPLISESGGVPRPQAKEFAEGLRRANGGRDIPGVTVLPTGQIEFGSPGARANYLRATHRVDNDGGYRETYNSER